MAPLSPKLPSALTVLISVLAPAALVAVSEPASGRLLFQEAAEEWGLDFRHRHGGRGDFYMTETMGSGVAVFDYDRDGDDDVFFVDSGTPSIYGEPNDNRSTLYRNDGGTFVDVREKSGIVVTSYGMGAVAGDVDGDGDQDLYVTGFGRNQLFLNRGDGTFEDTTERAGVGDELWGTSAVFADLDGDGDLDLYVTNYVDFDYSKNPPCGIERSGLRSYCHPNVYEPLPDRYFENQGNGTFVNATVRAGFGSAIGNGLGVVVGRIDDDWLPDLYVSNDMTANFLFSSQSGKPSFTEMALLAGAALSPRGEPEAGMGVALGDLNGDGRLDLITTHLDRQTNAHYLNLGGGMFRDARFQSKLAEPSVPYVGFGVVFADLESDGDQDVVIANGHIIHNVEEFQSGTSYAQVNQVFENRGGGVFVLAQSSGVDQVRVSRGLAVSDLDLDGDLDLLISNSNGVAEVYENRSVREYPWLALRLHDETSGNRLAIGARAVIRPAADPTTGIPLQVRELQTGASYLSQSSSEIWLASGADDTVEVQWPAGGVSRLRSVAGNRRVWVNRR